MKNFKTYCESLFKQPVSLSRWTDLLERDGWRANRNGLYSVVFIHPQKDYVIKIYKDSGYDVFISFLEKNQNNPNVVKIKKIISIEDPHEPDDRYTEQDSYSAIAIEKLEPLSIRSKKVDFIYALVGVLTEIIPKIPDSYLLAGRQEVKEYILYNFGDLLYRHIYNPNSFKYDNFGKSKNYKKIGMHIYNKILDHPIVDVILRLELYMRKNTGASFNSRWDLHKDNFMIRPSTGQLVLTDPLVGEREESD